MRSNFLAAKKRSHLLKATNKQRRAIKKQLRMEPLEARLPLAFDVSLQGSVVVFTGGSGVNSLTLSAGPGNLLQHNLATGGNLVSAVDMNSLAAGEQTIEVGSIVSLNVFGGTENDFVDASLLNIAVSLYGGLGNDILLGGAASDDIRGGDGDDTLEGNGGDDFLDWNDPEQSLGNDVLRGGAGNDSLLGGRFDQFFGGADTDSVNASDLSSVTLTDTTYTSSGVVSADHSIEFWVLVGNAGGNTIDASAWTISGLVIYGLGSNDFLRGGSQNDIIYGGNGNDTLEGNGGDDRLDQDQSESLGNDVLRGGAGNDTLLGGNRDQFFGGDDSDSVRVFDLNDATLTDTKYTTKLFGSDPIDSVNHSIETWELLGTRRGDFFDGSEFTLGSLTIFGGSGDDRIIGGSKGDVLNGGDGSDTLEGNGGDDLLDWTDSIEGFGNDTLRGGPGNDSLGGNEGDDTLEGGTGDDTLAGGTNNDRYIFDTDANLGSDSLTELEDGGFDLLNFAGTTTLGVTVSLNTVALQRVNANLQLTLNSAGSFEHIVGGQRSDNLTGNGLGNILQGNLGSDILTGLGGDDILRGNAGDDTFMFDADLPLGKDTLQDVEGGTDTLNFAATTTLGVDIDLSRTAVQVVNANLQLSLGGATQFENVFGGLLGDTLRGNANSNLLSGGLGDDRYVFDTDSSQGSDTITENAGGGTDTLDFSLTSSLRVVIDLGTTAAKTVNTNLKLILSNTDTVENVIGGSQADTILGNSQGNVIDGRSGDDVLNGGGGNDSLIGGTGLDTLVGGPGDDSLRGGSGNDIYRFKTDTPMGSDTIEELALEGKDRLNFDSTLSQAINVNLGLATAQVINPNLTLTLGAVDTMEYVTGGALNDTLTGNAKDNSLIGGPGNDVLIGLAGNDFLQGGLGNDVLDGGQGNDQLQGNQGDDTYRLDVDTPQGSDTLRKTMVVVTI